MAASPSSPSRRLIDFEVELQLGAVDETEMRELVLDAWRMAAPKRVVAAFDKAGG